MKKLILHYDPVNGPGIADRRIEQFVNEHIQIFNNLVKDGETMTVVFGNINMMTCFAVNMCRKKLNSKEVEGKYVGSDGYEYQFGWTEYGLGDGRFPRGVGGQEFEWAREILEH